MLDQIFELAKEKGKIVGASPEHCVNVSAVPGGVTLPYDAAICGEEIMVEEGFTLQNSSDQEIFEVFVCIIQNDASTEAMKCEVLKLLAERPGVVSGKWVQNGWGLMHFAAKSCGGEVIQALLKMGGEINDLDINNRSALHVAAAVGNQSGVQVLLGQGAVVNTTIQSEDKYHGYTLLHSAAETGNEIIINALLGAKEIDVNALTGKKETALSLYVKTEQCSAEVVESFFANGAGALLNALNEDGGYAVLHTVAYQRGCKEAIARVCLQQPGVEVDIRDNQDGYTPLHCAAERGNKAIVQLLIQHGARADLVNKKGDTARAIALRYGHQKIVNMLDDAAKITSSYIRKSSMRNIFSLSKEKKCEEMTPTSTIKMQRSNV